MKRPSLTGRFFIGLIRGYQRFISPLLGQRCRFHPSCSAYTIRAIEEKGAVSGLVKGLWRVLRCNPLNPGGYDPLGTPEQDAEASRLQTGVGEQGHSGISGEAGPANPLEK